MTRLNNNTNYRVDGYTNKWSIIDEYHGYVLLENNTWGDETCYLVTKKNNSVEDREYTKRNGEKVVLPTITGVVYETYDSIAQCLEDENIRF